MEDPTLLTRLTAVIAVLAGVIALSIAAYLHRRAKRRREAREAVERRGLQIVRKLRYCPFFSKEHDRRLASKFAKELDDFLAKEGYTFERLGITRAEVERIVRQTSAERTSEAAQRQLGLIAEHRDRHRAASPPPRRHGEPIVLPELDLSPATPALLTPLAEQVEPYGSTFTEADLSQGEGMPGPEVLASRAAEGMPMSCHADKPADEKVEFDLSDFEDPSPPAKDWSDPIKALQAAGDDELESYVDDRIAAIQVEDDKE